MPKRWFFDSFFFCFFLERFQAADLGADKQLDGDDRKGPGMKIVQRRFRGVGVLKAWVGEYPEDFLEVCYCYHCCLHSSLFHIFLIVIF